MQTLLEVYDQWNGLITIACGIYAVLLSYGYLPRNPKDPARMALWRKKFGPMMKILSPLIIVFGTFSLGGALLNDDSVAATVHKINLTAPEMLDPGTRFERATAGPGQRITFHNMVTTLKASQVSAEMWAKFSAELRKKIYQGNVIKFQRKGVTLVYRYRDTDGNLIGELVISPDDPKKTHP